MDAGAALALTSDEGQELLTSLPPYSERDVVRLTSQLRAEGHSPSIVAAALTQNRLRTRGAGKFGPDAAHMLFTADALEQATRPAVAALHAQRFVQAGMSGVIDGGCGIGADAIGFARAGLEVTGIEADAVTAELARHNLSAYPRARVVTGLVEEVAPTVRSAPPTGSSTASSATTAWWFDRARRVTGVADITGHTTRTFSLAALTPTWEIVQRLASTAPAAGAKLSPSLAHRDIPAGCEAEFVSYAGDVVETTLWWGAAAQAPGRSATIVRSTPKGAQHLHVTATDARGADTALATKATLGPWFYEADKALTRSGLVGALLRRVDGHEFTAGYGYVTSERFVDIGLLGRAYRVLDVVPLRTKTLRSYLRARDVGRLTIKKRADDTDADALRRSLKLKGPVSLTVVLLSLGGERSVLVVEPA